MGPPPVPQARRNATADRVSTWLDTEVPQQVSDVDQEMRDTQYASHLGQDSSSRHGKRPLDFSEDYAIMQEPIHHPIEQHPPAKTGYSFTPHLLPGARGAARHFPPPQPVASPGEDYEQLFDPERPLYEPQDPEMRELAANLVDNTRKTPPCEYRRIIVISIVDKFKQDFLDAELPDGMHSPRAHAQMIARNANSRMYAEGLDKLLDLCNAIECHICCLLPHNKRRYPPPPFCPSTVNLPVFPPCLDRQKFYVTDNLYDESIQLLCDSAYHILEFKRLGIAQDPLLPNDDVKRWFKNLGKMVESLNRMGVLIKIIGNRCLCGQWDYVAGMAEILEVAGGIWTIATGTLRPPNWEGKIPHLNVGIDPANIPPNSMIVAPQSPQVTRNPQQPVTPGDSPYNHQQQVNATDQYRTIHNPVPLPQMPVATSPGYSQHPNSTYQTASDPGTNQNPGTTYQTGGQPEYGQQLGPAYQTAGHSGYSQYPSTTYRTTSSPGTSQYPGNAYQMPGYSQQPNQEGDNSVYGQYTGQHSANRQWVPNPVHSQPLNSASAYIYPQQTNNLGQQAGTTNTGGPAWYPDGTQPNPFGALNRRLD